MDLRVQVQVYFRAVFPDQRQKPIVFRESGLFEHSQCRSFPLDRVHQQGAPLIHVPNAFIVLDRAMRALLGYLTISLFNLTSTKSGRGRKMDIACSTPDASSEDETAGPNRAARELKG